PGANAEAQFLRYGNVLAFNIPLDERIFELENERTLFPFFLGERIGSRDIPGGSIGETVVPNLSFADEIIQSGNHFLDGSHQIPGVEIVEIDVIRFETAERAFESTVGVLAAIAAGVRVAGLAVESEFRGDDQTIAQFRVSHKFSDHLLAVTVGVAV